MLPIFDQQMLESLSDILCASERQTTPIRLSGTLPVALDFLQVTDCANVSPAILIILLFIVFSNKRRLSPEKQENIEHLTWIHLEQHHPLDKIKSEAHKPLLALAINYLSYTHNTPQDTIEKKRLKSATMLALLDVLSDPIYVEIAPALTADAFDAWCFHCQKKSTLTKSSLKPVIQQFHRQYIRNMLDPAQTYVHNSPLLLAFYLSTMSHDAQSEPLTQQIIFAANPHLFGTPKIINTMEKLPARLIWMMHEQYQESNVQENKALMIDRLNASLRLSLVEDIADLSRELTEDHAIKTAYITHISNKLQLAPEYFETLLCEETIDCLLTHYKTVSQEKMPVPITENFVTLLEKALESSLGEKPVIKMANEENNRLILHCLFLISRGDMENIRIPDPSLLISHVVIFHDFFNASEADIQESLMKKPLYYFSLCFLALNDMKICEKAKITFKMIVQTCYLHLYLAQENYEPEILSIAHLAVMRSPQMLRLEEVESERKNNNPAQRLIAEIYIHTLSESILRETHDIHCNTHFFNTALAFSILLKKNHPSFNKKLLHCVLPRISTHVFQNVALRDSLSQLRLAYLARFLLEYSRRENYIPEVYNELLNRFVSMVGHLMEYLMECADRNYTEEKLKKCEESITNVFVKDEVFGNNKEMERIFNAAFAIKRAKILNKKNKSIRIFEALHPSILNEKTPLAKKAWDILKKIYRQDFVTAGPSRAETSAPELYVAKELSTTEVIWIGEILREYESIKNPTVKNTRFHCDTEINQSDGHMIPRFSVTLLCFLALSDMEAFTPEEKRQIFDSFDSHKYPIDPIDPIMPEDLQEDAACFFIQYYLRYRLSQKEGEEENCLLYRKNLQHAYLLIIAEREKYPTYLLEAIFKSMNDVNQTKSIEIHTSPALLQLNQNIRTQYALSAQKNNANMMADQISLEIYLMQLWEEFPEEKSINLFFNRILSKLPMTMLNTKVFCDFLSRDPDYFIRYLDYLTQNKQSSECFEGFISHVLVNLPETFLNFPELSSMLKNLPDYTFSMLLKEYNNIQQDAPKIKILLTEKLKFYGFILCGEKKFANKILLKNAMFERLDLSPENQKAYALVKDAIKFIDINPAKEKKALPRKKLSKKKQKNKKTPVEKQKNHSAMSPDDMLSVVCAQLTKDRKSLRKNLPISEKNRVIKNILRELSRRAIECGLVNLSNPLIELSGFFEGQNPDYLRLLELGYIILGQVFFQAQAGRFIPVDQLDFNDPILSPDDQIFLINFLLSQPWCQPMAMPFLQTCSLEKAFDIYLNNQHYPAICAQLLLNIENLLRENNFLALIEIYTAFEEKLDAPLISLLRAQLTDCIFRFNRSALVHKCQHHHQTSCLERTPESLDELTQALIQKLCMFGTLTLTGGFMPVCADGNVAQLKDLDLYLYGASQQLVLSKMQESFPQAQVYACPYVDGLVTVKIFSGLMFDIHCEPDTHEPSLLLEKSPQANVVTALQFAFNGNRLFIGNTVAFCEAVRKKQYPIQEIERPYSYHEKLAQLLILAKLEMKGYRLAAEQHRYLEKKLAPSLQDSTEFDQGYFNSKKEQLQNCLKQTSLSPHLYHLASLHDLVDEVCLPLAAESLPLTPGPLLKISDSLVGFFSQPRSGPASPEYGVLYPRRAFFPPDALAAEPYQPQGGESSGLHPSNGL